MMLDFAGPGKAMFGVVAVLLPAAVVVFGVVVAAMFGWRAWFGVQEDDKPKKPKSRGGKKR